jgi:hypothetical protein
MLSVAAPLDLDRALSARNHHNATLVAAAAVLMWRVAG